MGHAVNVNKENRQNLGIVVLFVGPEGHPAYYQMRKCDSCHQGKAPGFLNTSPTGI